MKKFKRVKMKFYYFLCFLLFSSSWYYIIYHKSTDFLNLFSNENRAYSMELFKDLLGLNNKNPAFFIKKEWLEIFELSMSTLKMSILAIGIASVSALISVILLTYQFKSSSGKIFQYFLKKVTQMSYVFSRSIPVVIWAMLIIFILKPGILPGAIALGIHNYGILGKLFLNTVEALPQRPMELIEVSGGNFIDVFFYGIYPTLLPKFLTYILFRWEVILRNTIVVGFVGAGGLGQAFRLSLSYFQYTRVTLIIIAYLILVFLADQVTLLTRKLIQ